MYVQYCNSVLLWYDSGCKLLVSSEECIDPPPFPVSILPPVGYGRYSSTIHLLVSVREVSYLYIYGIQEWNFAEIIMQYMYSTVQYEYSCTLSIQYGYCTVRTCTGVRVHVRRRRCTYRIRPCTGVPVLQYRFSCTVHVHCEGGLVQYLYIFNEDRPVTQGQAGRAHART